MSIVLGLCFGHDASAALVKDGKLVCAISKERINRKKKHAGVSKALIDYVLDEAGIRFEDVTALACGEYKHFDRVDAERGRYEPHQLKVYHQEPAEGPHLVREVKDSLRTSGIHSYDMLNVVHEGIVKPMALVQHHLAHCAAAYYTSPFEQAACFSVDGSFEIPEYCSLYALGSGSELKPLYCPGVMIGNTYAIFTEFLGLGSGLTKAGTTMGLASYGTIKPIARERLEYYKKSFWHRPIENELTFIKKMWAELSGLPEDQRLTREQSDGQFAMDIAASLQFIFEEVLIDYAELLYQRTKDRNGGNLCLAGGSFLNCDTNTKIIRRSGFSNVHLFPGCGDDGTAVGAALYVAHHLMKQPRHAYGMRDIAYLGRSYPIPELGRPLDVREAARVLSDGGIVALYQDGAEFGPRALGNRSILADPRRAEMRDVLNHRIKKREWFRPFAPAVLAHKARDWFNLDVESKYMLLLAEVKRPEEIPAATHVDNSARPQTVERADNPLYYDLIAAFEEITGVPVLINTSLNVNEEPLVETPEDALRFFRNTGVDLLILGNRMLRQEDLPPV